MKLNLFLAIIVWNADQFWSESTSWYSKVLWLSHVVTQNMETALKKSSTQKLHNIWFIHHVSYCKTTPLYFYFSAVYGFKIGGSKTLVKDFKLQTTSLPIQRYGHLQRQFNY